MNNALHYLTIFRRAVAPVLIFMFVIAGTPGCCLPAAGGPMLHMGAGSQGAQHDQHVQHAELDRWIREELYFGSQIPNGGAVTDAEWQEFVDNEITPRFPKGLTTHTANGQYRYTDGTLGKEKTWIVIVYHFGKPDDNDKPLEEIMTLYKTRFQQESVMRVTNVVDVRVR